MQLSAILRYPVKSCRGESLSAATVEPWGLAGDRRWMVVDASGDAITAREHPRLILALPRYAAGGLVVTHPDLDELTVPPPTGEILPVRVHGHPVLAMASVASADAWFSKIIGEPVRLVFLDDPTRRAPNPSYALPSDRVTFADAYPLLVTSSASLDALNDWIVEGGGEPVPMTRFRPNVVVSGAAPWAEDSWRRVTIGSVPFRAVKACDRCVLTTVDPDTGEKGKEPIRTLARYRKWDGKTWFGVNLIPDAPGSIAVGEAVSVLESGDGSEPLR